MILPIGDDNPKEITPYVHYGIMAVNVVVFFYSLSLGWRVEDFYKAWGLVPASFSGVKLFTSMYLHGDIWHLFGNMLFLWIVGDNVEDRLGHVGYFVFYHLAGVAACLAHVAFSPNSPLPLIGASGAISGMMGAYAVFFPNAKIKIWYWLFFFFTNVVYVSAKWAVGLWFAEQILLRTVLGPTGVAYDAHIGGIVFGVAAAFFLRKVILKKPDTVSRVFGTARSGARWGQVEEVPWTEPAPVAAVELETELDPNTAIARGLRAGDLQLAYRYFTRAAGAADRARLDETVLLELGQALVMVGGYGHAARVYEVMLETHAESPDAAEAAFRLGTILSRAFADYDRARPWLTKALETHDNVQRRRQALDEIKRIDAHLRRLTPFRRRP